MTNPLDGLMKQAQQMQENMKQAQDELAKMEVRGESGGGLVKITMTGRHEIRGIQIDQSLYGDDKDMLEDLIVAAMNDAVRKVADASKGKMSGLASGFNLPPGFKLPF